MGKCNYDRLCTVPLNEVLPVINEVCRTQNSKEKRFLEFQGATVKIAYTSLRLRTFAVKGTRCVCCGLEASFFAVEKSRGVKEAYHINLWGVKDGNEVLFTHDHILARALGGADNMSNSQTMCGPCNWKKGKVEGEEFKRRRKLGDITHAPSNKTIRRVNKSLGKQQEKWDTDPEYRAKVLAHRATLAAKGITPSGRLLPV